MKAGILAAGEGSRFVRAGWDVPKPLIRVGGKPILVHVLDNLFHAGIETVDIILNGEERFDQTEAFIESLPQASRIRVWRKSTRSSFESFCFLTDQLREPPFVISTVDAVTAEQDLRDFLDLRTYPDTCSLALAVTDFVRDEKPLWVEMTEKGRIVCIGEGVRDKRHVTAGLYLVLKELNARGPNRDRFPALRNYLGHLMEIETPVWGKMFERVLDIDEPEDIEIAESVHLV